MITVALTWLTVGRDSTKHQHTKSGKSLWLTSVSSVSLGDGMKEKSEINLFHASQVTEVNSDQARMGCSRQSQHSTTPPTPPSSSSSSFIADLRGVYNRPMLEETIETHRTPLYMDLYIFALVAFVSASTLWVFQMAILASKK